MQALVHNGIVIEVEPDGSQFPVASPMEWVQTTQSVEPGWTYDGTSLAPPPAPTLDDVATAQIGALKESFVGAALTPVTDSNGVEWNGGEHSASSIDGAVRLAQNTGASTVDLWDYANAKHSLSVSAAQAVVDAVAGAYQTAFQKYQGLRAQVVAIQQMAARANSTAYQSGAEVTDGNGNVWKCTTAGTSGSKQPSWTKSPTTSSTVTDGGVTWTFSQTQEAAMKAVSW